MSKLFLLCTDLDRTLLPNGNPPESPGARAAFARLAEHEKVTLAYVSGRDRVLVEDAINEYRLPMPDWVIGDVGTTIYEAGSDVWQHWQEWEQEIAADWRGLTAQDLQPIFRDMPTLRLQEQAKQNRYKLSYYLPIELDSDSLMQDMERCLDTHNLAANLIYSVDEMSATALLDVLPARATKLHAIEFLMRHLGFDYPNTVFAGDSGNDLPVLTSKIQSVLVANASPEIARQAQAQAQQQGHLASFYLAKGGFLGMNGNYSAGILEGIAHFIPETKPWMEAVYGQ